jgi:hypothetical protein
MRRAGELLRVLAKHLLDGSDPGRQTEALKGAVHILPSRLEAGLKVGNASFPNSTATGTIPIHDPAVELLSCAWQLMIGLLLMHRGIRQIITASVELEGLR